jgi:predicted HTH transcriptional regulator
MRLCQRARRDALYRYGFLKRAALLLFHHDPELFVTGAYIKIGYFETDADLLFQDEVHGNLFEQVEKIIDLLFTKAQSYLTNRAKQPMLNSKERERL